MNEQEKREKRIEDLISLLAFIFVKKMNNNGIKYEDIAEALDNAGYRKADEVRKETAKEIFTNIIENIDSAQRGLQSDDDKEWYRNKLYYKGLCWARRIVIDIMKEFGVEVEE